MKRPSPTGTVTFLFADIEGSTARWERSPDGMTKAIQLHDAIAADSVAGAGGIVFKTTGDGFCAAFGDADSAVSAALTLRERLANADWPESVGPLQARAAIHTGSAEERNGDYFGPTVNRVARLMSAAHGGQILVSEAARQLLTNQSIRLRDLGEHRLRDLLRPEHIYQVGETEHQYPPLLTLDAHTHNLPVQVTPFVGRERELKDLVSLVAASPLVTMTGPGGTGKTRLALQAAAELVAGFERAIFVGLASIRTEDDVGPAIVRELGLQTAEAGALGGILSAHLASRRTLLILDNFEHVIGAAPLIGSLLDAAADLRILVTSRELLRLRAERSYPVAPLQVPGVSQTLSATDLASYEAIRLFEERAQAARPDFRVDGSNADDVAAICRRLDGLPLAIELAAARTRLLTPAQLRSVLEDDFRMLGSGPRDAPERQRTLTDTIRWSYDLLEEPDQIVFRRLGVFVGGCALDAIDDVCLHDLDLDSYTVVEVLSDKSLVKVEQDHLGETRLQMLETIRSFARSELEMNGELADLLLRHALFFVLLAESAEQELRGRSQEDWMRRLDEERPNIEAALAWGFEGGDESLALRLVAALRDYWFYQGRYRDMGRWASRAMSNLAAHESGLQAGVLLTAGFHAFGIYRDDAVDLLSRAAGLYEKAKDDVHQALAIVYEAGARELLPGDPEHTQRRLEEGLNLARSVGAMNVEAQALNLWGELERRQGRYEQARQIQEQALELARHTGELRRVAMVTHNLGLIAHHLGDDAAADRLLRESLGLAKELGFDAQVSHCLIALAEQIALRGDPERGATLIGAADGHFKRLGLVAQPADAPDYERIRADILEMLGEDRYQSALERGWKLGLDEAMDLTAT